MSFLIVILGMLTSRTQSPQSVALHASMASQA